MKSEQIQGKIVFVNPRRIETIKENFLSRVQKLQSRKKLVYDQKYSIKLCLEHCHLPHEEENAVTILN